MRMALVIGAAATVAAIVLTSASAGPPPLPAFRFAATQARPIAGKRFTAITVTYIATPIAQVQCQATLGGVELYDGREQRFYAPGITGPDAVSCYWPIPRGSAGKLFQASAGALTPTGASYGGGDISARVKR